MQTDQLNSSGITAGSTDPVSDMTPEASARLAAMVDGAPAVQETHCAVLFFTGDRAFKVKKPLDLGFVDFRTPEARRDACRRELELNRQFAPDVYLNVLAITPDGGPPCDWAVQMRRMPDGRRLSTLIGSGNDVNNDLREVARRLAAHHAQAARSSRIDRAGSPEALQRRWTENLDGLREFQGSVLDRNDLTEISRLALGFVYGRHPLLRERVSAGRIRDGHGDLLADDIFCLDDGPRILDCLEFNDDLRAVDGLDDAACLAMDLERLGAAAAASQFLDWFAEFSGESRVDSLIHHYIAYRAVVRAKVACLRWAQDRRPETAALALRFVRLAIDHLRAGQPGLVLVGGTPGTGKSTLAGALADRFGAVLLRSDRVRKELAGIPEHEHTTNEWRGGLYAPGPTQDTYDRLMDVARQLLAHGESVVLDASWSTTGERSQARQAAADMFSPVVELRCEAPAAVIDDRIRDRRHRADPSDATPAIARLMEREFQSWPEATQIDTTAPLDQTIDQATRLFRPR